MRKDHDTHGGGRPQRTPPGVKNDQKLLSRKWRTFATCAIFPWSCLKGCSVRPPESVAVVFFVSLFSYQLKGSLECSVNVEVFLAEKTEALPQLWLPRKEVESPTNPREGQKLKGISSTNNSHIISNSRVCWIIHNPKYKQREEKKDF